MNNVIRLAGIGILLGIGLALLAVSRVSGDSPSTGGDVGNLSDTARIGSDHEASQPSGKPTNPMLSKRSVADSSTQITAADLELVGTLATGDPATSVALILAGGESSDADDNAPAAMHYRIGETLPGGGVLADIAPRSVDIDLGVTRVTLVISTADGITGNTRGRFVAAPANTPAANEQLALGGCDGESIQSGVTTDAAASSAAPVRRSRTGLLLTDEQRAAMQALIPED